MMNSNNPPPQLATVSLFGPRHGEAEVLYRRALESREARHGRRLGEAGCAPKARWELSKVGSLSSSMVKSMVKSMVNLWLMMVNDGYDG